MEWRAIGIWAIAGIILTAGCAPARQLEEGGTYWVETWFGGHSQSLYTKPQSGVDNYCGAIENGAKATLIKQDGRWCYIEGSDRYGRHEGWIPCTWLTDHEVTPIPTPNRTPQRP